jgi:hypothetical protein
MTKGVVLFAFNTEIDYVKMSINSAERIKNYLGLPVTLVTDSVNYLYNSFENKINLFDKIIKSEDTTLQTKKFCDGYMQSARHVWKNTNRANVFDISPYEQTLVIDVDYIINSSFLNNCFEIDKDFLIFKDSCDLSGWRKTDEFKYLNQYSIPFYWATVFYFTKNKKNEIFFDLVRYIRDNWEYYRLIYQINDKKFRNDFAFSIAIHILNGMDTENFDGIIPGKMFYTLDKDVLISLKENACVFLVEKESKLGEYTSLKTSSVDVHVMNKHSLLRMYDAE